MRILISVVWCCLLSLTLDPVAGSESKAALIIIDMQDCFISGGSLAVSGGNDIIPIINKIRADFKAQLSMVVLSQDWHPAGHVSFLSSHPGVQNPMSLNYSTDGYLCEDGQTVTTAKFPAAISCDSATVTLTQTLWPDHCIQNVNSGPESSALAAKLVRLKTDLIVQKGIYKEVDSYSAFFDNGGFGKTNLDNELKKGGITHVFVTGLAGDYCVFFTSMDAKKLGYETYYVQDATRSVAEDTGKEAVETLAAQGVHVITTNDLAAAFDDMVNSGGHLVSLISVMVTVGFILIRHLC